MAFHYCLRSPLPSANQLSLSLSCCHSFSLSLSLSLSHTHTHTHTHVALMYGTVHSHTRGAHVVSLPQSSAAYCMRQSCIHTCPYTHTHTHAHTQIYIHTHTAHI